MASERVQKILAQAGIASRRKSEELIEEGLVTINGKIAQLGDKAEWGKDAIKVKGKLLLKPEALTYLIFHKPKAVIGTLSDPEGRPCIGTFLDSLKVRVFPIGRLDFNSDGIMLLTNDGDFAEKLQKRDDIPRVYSVKIKGHTDTEMLERLKRGARMGTGQKRLFKPHDVRVLQKLANKTVIQLVVLGSGAFDVKSYFEMKGFLVEKFTRTSIGHLTLKGLEAGHFRYIKASQAYALLEQPELGMRKLEFESEKARKRDERREAGNTTKPRITPRPSVRSTSAKPRVIKPTQKRSAR